MKTKSKSSSFSSGFKISKLLSLSILFLYVMLRPVPHTAHRDLDNPRHLSTIISKFSLLTSKNHHFNSKSKFSIFDQKFPSKASNISNFKYFSILLLLSGNIELNPGPRTPKFPCGVCRKACTWKQQAVACDECDTWYHKQCLTMDTQIYNNLNNVSWYCCACGLPNFSSGLFNSTTFNLADYSLNSFYPLSPEYTPPNSNPLPQTPRSKPVPLSASTPKDPPKGSIKHPTRGIKTLVINFQSLWNKKVELSNLASDTKSDIIIGTETWLVSPEEDEENGHKNSELLLEDYDIFRRDRPTRGGGVLIAVKKDLCCEEISSSKETEAIFCKINIKNSRPLVIGSVYRAPDLDLELCRKLSAEIYNTFNKSQGSIFWLGGDFNLPDINWKNQDIQSNRYPHQINELFLEMSQDLGLQQLVDFPTRGTSILDLFFTNKPDLVNECRLLSGLGDHEAVSIKNSLFLKRKKPTKRKILLWNRADVNKMKEKTHAFRTTFLDTFSADSDVNEMWDYIKKEIFSIIEKHVPSKFSSTKTHQPWINTETKRLIRQKNRWLHKAKTLNSENVWKTYRKIKRVTQRTCRQTHENYLRNLFENDKSNKKLWSYIKSRKQQNVGIPEIKDVSNVPTSDPVKKANLIRQQFDSVFSNPEPPIQAFFEEEDRLPTIEPIIVNPLGIKKLLKNLNPNKAIGPDNIPGQFLKLFADDLADILSVLFQASLDQGILPTDWKVANIVPLFKKGNKSLPENYRPISLTCLTCKILEHVVFSSVMSHFEKYNVLDDAQHGFRKKRSTISQLVITVNDFASTLRDQKQTDAILLDFSKAFDKVDHEGLLSKLDHLGINGPLLKWARSFLVGREQRVVVEGMESTPSKVLSGVPQGTVLGPLFFLIYINDISKGLSEGTKIRLFADDSLLYRTIESPSDAAILQKDLNTLQLWEKKWKMEFHPGKCQLLRITNKNEPIKPTYFIHDTPISETDSAKYLGVVIDNKLKWTKQYSNLIKKVVVL